MHGLYRVEWDKAGCSTLHMAACLVAATCWLYSTSRWDPRPRARPEGPWYGVSVWCVWRQECKYTYLQCRRQCLDRPRCHRLTWPFPKHGASGCGGAVARAYICEPSGSRVLGPPSCQGRETHMNSRNEGALALPSPHFQSHESAALELAAVVVVVRVCGIESTRRAGRGGRFHVGAPGAGADWAGASAKV